MTTLKETALSISRLTIGEIPQSESNSSGSWHEATQSDQSAPTQLESNDDEMGVFSCVKLSDKDMNVIEDKAGRPDVNKDRPLAFDKREDGVSTQCGMCTQNPRQNRCKTNGAKRRLPQTSISHHFRQRKRSRGTINLKSASGQKKHVRDYNDADTLPANLNVKNMGTMCIGDNIKLYNINVTYCDGLPEQHTGDQLTADDVVADGGHGVIADGGVILASPQRGPVFCTDKNMKRLQQIVYTVTNEIYHLRDNGRWVEFHKEVDTKLQLAKEEKLYEVEIFVMIEKATALSYEGKSDKALKMLKQARNMLLRRPNLGILWKFLLVLLHCQLAAIYRRGNKLEKAYEALHIAKQNLESVRSDLAKVYVLYEMANLSLQSSYLCSSRDERDNYIEQAKTEFQNCFSLCERSEEEGVYVRRHHFCLVKKALLNLFCETTEARNQEVSEGCIREAGECITRMQQQYSEQMGASTAILLLAAECDYYHRQGDHCKAENFAQQALLQAENFGFQLEFQKLRD